MKLLRLTLFGFEIATLDVWPDYDTDPEPREEIAGGSAHNFERDQQPPDPSGEQPWDHFGFNGKQPPQ